MRILFLAWVLFAFQATHAASTSDIGDLVKDLSDDRFEVREDANIKLGRLPSKYAKKFALMSRDGQYDLETRTRLLRASRIIYLRKIFPTTERYLRLFGLIGFEYEAINYDEEYGCEGDRDWAEEEVEEEAEDGEEGPPWENGYKVVVTYPDTDADDKLRRWDLVIEVDGESPEEFFEVPISSDYNYSHYGPALAGKEYEFTVRRFSNIKAIEKRGWLHPPEAGEYKDIKIKVRAGHKNVWHVDQDVLEDIKKHGWIAFIESLPPVAPASP